MNRSHVGSVVRKLMLFVAAIPLLQATGCALTDAVVFELTNLVSLVVGQAVEIVTLNLVGGL